MSSPTVWVVDDDRSIRWVLEKALQGAGLEHAVFESAKAVRKALEVHTPTVVMTDIRMPEEDGLSLLEHLHAVSPKLPVIVMTAHSDLDSAVASYSKGAFEYLPKPFDVDDAILLVRRALERQKETYTVNERKVGDENPLILGEAPAMQDVFRAIGRLAQAEITVLINGESGTGKELVAKAVHANSPRKAGPFIALNMAAIPKDLVESELFGHEKGAFTGAQAQRIGRFEQALGGTLFLDEIGDMHPELQTRLLRVLSSQEFYRVGGHKPIKSDVRIIAATNQSIEELIKTSKFREDLYHRLNVFKLELPPLRKRKEDIPSLISHFLKSAAIELNTEQKTINKKTMAFLEDFDWPGNIRQLENTCRYLTVMSASSTISMDDLPQDIFNNKGLSENQNLHDVSWQTSLEDFIRSEIGSDKNILKKVNSEIEKILIDESLRASNGIKLEAAKLLGWGRNTLARKAKNT